MRKFLALAAMLAAAFGGELAGSHPFATADRERSADLGSKALSPAS